MAYYGSYAQYSAPMPGQQQYSTISYAPISPFAYSTGGYSSTAYTQQPISGPAPIPSMVSYGGAASYKVNLPQYLAGPSYSTTSDNDFNYPNGGSGNLPVAGYGSTGYTTGGCGYSSAATFPNNNTSYQSDSYYYSSQNRHQCQHQHSQRQSPSPSPSPSPKQDQHEQQQQKMASQSQTGGCSQSQHSFSQGNAQSSQHSISQAQLNSEAVQALDQPNNNICAHVNDQLSSLAPQIEAAYEAATSQRRQPVIKRQVITVPGTPGRIQQVVRRLPTPTPDIVERVFVVKPQRDIINLVIERPGTPPAQYKDRTVMGKQRRPLIHPRIVRVAARSTTQYQQIQYQPQQQYQYLQALPAPSPAMFINNRAPPSTTISYQQQYHQPLTSQTPEQPALSQLSQGHLSSTEQLSQNSDSNLGQQNSGHMSQGPKGYLIAPLAYDDSSCQSYMPAMTIQSGYAAAPPNNNQQIAVGQLPEQLNYGYPVSYVMPQMMMTPSYYGYTPMPIRSYY